MITRSKMRRQLYRGGGITGLYPRKKFGLGSDLKDTFRKLIPNELADIAVKAAPFVAPFNPLAAGMMRGLGRLDQRGNLTDALKQGIATYGIGQLAQKMGTGSFQELQNPFTKEAFRNPVAGMFEGLRPPVSEKAAVKTITDAGITPDAAPVKSKIQGPLSKFLYGTAGDAASQGAIGAGGEFAMKKAFGKGLPAVYAGGTLAALAVQKALGDVGGRETGESLTAFNKRRENTVSQYLDFYFRRANKFRIAPENMDAAAAKFVTQNTQEYRAGGNQGGRVGLKHGTGIMDIHKLQTGAPPITYEGDMRPNKRMNQMGGTGPNGLPGIPRQAPDGMEFDMRQNGGFQPLGAKEKKDDVPAMLAKNEFVFTADAVRGAGDGDVEKGAQRMYDTMQKLERRVV